MEKTMMLSFWRLLGAILTFAIPVFLSRFLSIDDYATYKLVMLIQGVAVFILPLGVDGSLFYFIESDRSNHAIYSLNVSLFALCVGALSAVFCHSFRHEIAGLLQQPDFADYTFELGLFLCVSLASNHLQVYCIYLDELRWAIYTELSYQIAKAAAIILGFWFTESLHTVLWCLICIHLCQLLGLGIYLSGQFHRNQTSLSKHLKLLKKQLHYGLPLGCSNLVMYASDFDRLLISSLFGARDFAIYTVGCFRVPFVHSIEATLLDYMGLGMVKSKAAQKWQEFRDLWKQTTRHILRLQIPLCIFLSVFADPIIELIYSQQYSESGIIFTYFALIGIVNSDQPDMIYRSLSKTRTLFIMQVIYGVLSFGLIYVGALHFGLTGAVIGKLCAHVISLSVKLVYYKRHLKVALHDIYDWGLIIRLSGSACLLALAVQYGIFAPISSYIGEALALLISLGLYALLMSLTMWHSGILNAAEKERVRLRLVQARETISMFLTSTTR